MLNRINQSLTEKTENISENLKYSEQEFSNLWNKTQFDDSEFWFLKTGWHIIWLFKVAKLIKMIINIFE